MFQKDIHAFRAIAILFIVGGHARAVLEWDANRDLGNFLVDFLTNGTMLFVFVAGYLFHALSGRFQYPNYLGTKFRNVVIPYLVVSVPAIYYSVFYKDATLQFPQLAGTSETYQVIWFYIKGGAHLNYPLWFIPMIVLFFVAAPLFMLFIRYPRLYYLLAPLAIVSVLIHRAPYPHLDTLQLAIYFLPVYLAGMATSQFRSRVNVVLERRFWHLIAGFVLVLAAQYFLAAKHGLPQAAAWFSAENGLIDWPFIQKMVLCYALLAICHRYQDKLYPALNYVALSSFGIYFVHVYFLTVIPRLLPSILPNGSLPNFVLLTMLALSLSALACFMTQVVFGRYSRLLIGCETVERRPAEVKIIDELTPDLTNTYAVLPAANPPS